VAYFAGRDGARFSLRIHAGRQERYYEFGPGIIIEEPVDAVAATLRRIGRIVEVAKDGSPLTPGREDLAALTAVTLRDRARDAGIQGASGMKKAELVAALEAHSGSAA
jgi:hypothetical protein